MPHKTPLRYPGGKQRLAPFILEILETNGLLGGDYVEPYAGGAGVAIELLLENNVRRVHLNDSCRSIYAFWKAILTKTDEFCRRIRTVPLTVTEWRRQREILSRPDEFDDLELGFSTFYLNRCNRSGILVGSGLIGGLKQSGEWKMDARFPREGLAKRVEAIAARKTSISLRQMDAEDFILGYVSDLPKRTLVYCDPPYFQKAQRLYFDHYAPDDHARIASVIQRKIKHPWIVSYDNAPAILQSYLARRSFNYEWQYNAASCRKGTEVFFFSDNLKLPRVSGLACINVALTRERSGILD